MRRDLHGPEHEQFRAAFRDFVARHVVPHRQAWAEAGCVDREAWLAAGEAGFLCPTLDPRYGGAGRDFLCSVIIAEELARVHEPGFGLNLHSDIVVPYIAELGTEEQKDRYLPTCVTGETIGAIGITEAGGGSDLAAIQTRATFHAADDEYELEGLKSFVSNGELCDFVIVVARTGDETDVQRSLSLFLVDARVEGFRRVKRLHKLGLASQDASVIQLDRCRVPSSALLGRPGAAVPSILQRLQQERLLVAVMAQARAEQVIEETLEYAKSRTVGGRALASFQDTAFKLADCATQVEVGRAHVDRLCAAHLAGEFLQKECAMAKLWHTEMLSRVADACLQVWGGAACMSEHGVGRAFVDSRLQRIYAGPSEIMKAIIANQLGLR